MTIATQEPAGPPDEHTLYRRIADRVPDAEPDTVRTLLAGHGIVLSTPLPARRELVVHRLYCEGTKTGTDDNDGPFILDQRFGPGAWALRTASNSAGKSSLLWALSFALRGEGFAGFARKDTIDWFTYIRADFEVSGVPASVRLTFTTPGKPETRLLTAQSVDQLLALEPHQNDGDGVRTAATAAAGGAKELLDRFMLERLGLRPVSVWAAEKGAPKDTDGNRDSVEQVHGWPSYFYAIAMNSANDGILLGPTVTGQLPVRLMQLFLDVPFTSELTYLTTARKRETQNDRRAVRRATEDAQARQEQTEPLRRALAEAQQRLAECEAQQPDHADLLAELDRTSHAVTAATEGHRAAKEHHDTARKLRLQDERNLRRARQSAAARMLLGALDPEACPRCDHPIDDARRATENTNHHCSLCANPLPDTDDDPQARAAHAAQLEQRITEAKNTEASCRATLDQAEKHLADTQRDYQVAGARMAAVRTSNWAERLDRARREVHQIQGALAVAAGTPTELPAAVTAYLTTSTHRDDADEPRGQQVEPNPDDLEDHVLEAAAKVVGDVVSSHSRTLLPDLNEQIVRIGRALAVKNLTGVNLTLGGQLNATKSGKSVAFASFSPTDRLKMRIATVVAMIAVGRKHGIMSHPGLLLIDAPTADELATDTAATALKTLYDTGEMPGMQVIITSIEPAVCDIWPAERIHTGVPDNPNMF